MHERMLLLFQTSDMQINQQKFKSTDNILSMIYASNIS